MKRAKARVHLGSLVNRHGHTVPACQQGMPVQLSFDSCTCTLNLARITCSDCRRTIEQFAGPRVMQRYRLFDSVAAAYDHVARFGISWLRPGEPIW